MILPPKLKYLLTAGILPVTLRGHCCKPAIVSTFNVDLSPELGDVAPGLHTELGFLSKYKKTVPNQLYQTNSTTGQWNQHALVGRSLGTTLRPQAACTEKRGGEEERKERWKAQTSPLANGTESSSPNVSVSGKWVVIGYLLC